MSWRIHRVRSRGGWIGANQLSMHIRVLFVTCVVMNRESLIDGSEVRILKIKDRFAEATLPAINGIALVLTLRKTLRRRLEMTWSCLRWRMGRRRVGVCRARLRRRVWVEAVLRWDRAEELESCLG